MTVDSGVPGLGRLTQLWVVIGVLHGVMTKGKKLTQATHTATPPLPRADLLTCIWTCGVAARALVPHQADGVVREPRRGQPAGPRRVWRSGRAVWRPLPARGPRRDRVAARLHERRGLAPAARLRAAAAPRQRRLPDPRRPGGVRRARLRGRQPRALRARRGEGIGLPLCADTYAPEPLTARAAEACQPAPSASVLGIPQAQGDLPQGAQSCPHTDRVRAVRVATVRITWYRRSSDASSTTA